MKSFFMYEYPSNFCLNLISKPAGEPVFLVFSQHITAWYNDDRVEEEEYTQVTYPRWKFLPQSSINYIMAGQILALTDDEKRIKRLALEGERDPDDPKPPPKKKTPVPGPSKSVVKSDTPAPPKPSQAKRKSGNPPKGNSTTLSKKVKIDSHATTPSDHNKAEIIELRRQLRDAESDLKSATLKVGALEDKEQDTKKAYEDAMKKMQETIDDYDDLIELKRATYNHFLSKWENDNVSNQGDDVTPLKNAFPVTLRKYFLEDIEKDKNALE